MGKRNWGKRAVLLVLLGLSILAAAGCSELIEEFSQELESALQESDMQENGEMAAPAFLPGQVEQIMCEPHENEVEPGACSYIVDCNDIKTCGAWAERMIVDLEEWYGTLTYSEEWEYDDEMLRKSKKDTELVASYPVLGNSIDVEPKDEEEAYYAWLWQRFAWVIPAEYRTMVSHFEVFDHIELMAYVIQDEDEYEKWTYSANYEQATYETERILTDIHEFGHLLGLNAGQIDPYQSEKSCKTYMFEEGCARSSSYMYAFYERFWEQGQSEDEHDYVSEYAMNDLYEDFAESWSHFVVTLRPKGRSIADQKLLFFHQYDELVMLRAAILGRMASWMERNAVYE